MSDKTPDGTPDDTSASSDDGDGELSIGKIVELDADADGNPQITAMANAIKIGDTIVQIGEATRRSSATVGSTRKFTRKFDQIDWSKNN
jgi:hypothetical protein